jgi:hypothetical protein
VGGKPSVPFGGREFLQPQLVEGPRDGWAAAGVLVPGMQVRRGFFPLLSNLFISEADLLFFPSLSCNDHSCPFSDSRVSEGTIFSAPPGALFTQRNIANQFQPIDNNAISVLSYGVQFLGVGHIIVMGHYGCGGVQAAMMPRPNTTDDFSGSSVQDWINPIRHTYLNSSR